MVERLRVLLTAAFWAVVAVAGPAGAAGGEFNRLDAYVDEQMRTNGVPGAAVAVVRGGKVVHFRGYGEAAPGIPVTPQTPFQLGSVSKSFTAMAVMQLVEDGKVDLDAPVRTYLPWFRLADERAAATVTLRHLLSHTSGLSTRAGLQHASGQDAGEPTLERMVRALAEARPTAPVGEKFQYSNANYTVAAAVVEAASGVPFNQFLQDRVLSPLGMRQSFTSEEDAMAHGLALGHRLWYGYPVAAPGLTEWRGRIGAGAVLSSAEDLGLYLAALMGGGAVEGRRVLSPAGVETLFRPIARVEPDARYALGWFVRERPGERLVYHGGDLHHFHADVVMAPDDGVGVAVLMNANSAMQTEALHAVSRNFLALARGRELEPLPRTPVIMYTPAAHLAVQALLAVAAVWATLRGSASPRARPHWRRWGMALLVVTNLALAVALVVATLRIGDVAVPILFSFAPDFAWTLAVNLAVALTFAAAWGVGVVRRRRAAAPGGGPT